NNTFHDNGVDDCGTDIVIYGNNHQIYNNVFYNTREGAISVQGNGDGIYNNTFYNTGNSGACTSLQPGIWVGGATNSHTIQNNLIVNSANAIKNASNNSTISDNSTTNSIINTGSGNIISTNNIISSGTESSIFMNVSTGDFTLKAGSTPIDRGAAISFIKTDRAGMPRPYGSAYDIGAYEFQGTSVTSIAPPSNLRVVP